MRKILLLISAFLLSGMMHAQIRPTWVATDALGRTLPTAAECPLKTDGKQRTVGIFYVTWHTPEHLDDNFTDTRGDVIHRDFPGYGNLQYTDSTGRNDIMRCHVAIGKKNVYFAAETADTLTPYTDSNWMLLFIDADQNSRTGCCGYDFLINKEFRDGKAVVKRYDEMSHAWKNVGEATIAVKGNIVELSIPRRLLGMRGNNVDFDFKWADNPSAIDDIIAISTTGDTAPNRRFNYRFCWRER